MSPQFGGLILLAQCAAGFTGRGEQPGTIVGTKEVVQGLNKVCPCLGCVHPSTQHFGLTGGGVCPNFHACGCRGGGGERGGGWKEHGSMFPACRGQLVVESSRSRPPSPTRQVTSPLSARPTRLHSPICLSDTLPLFRRWF